MFFSTVNLALSQPTSLSELWDKMIPPSVGAALQMFASESRILYSLLGVSTVLYKLKSAKRTAAITYGL